MLRFLFFLFFFSTFVSLSAQTSGPGHGIICTMRDTAVDAFTPPPAAFLNGTVEVKTQFELVFSEEVPQEARAAMRFAADVWGRYLDSGVPVRVNIDWQDRGNNRLLASAGPATLFRDFAGGTPNTWYPVALAEAIAGRNLNATDDADINVNANSTANWYFGTDGNTPRNRIDLVSVMLHELGHGLGFLASVDTINDNQLSIGFGDRFIIYDLFLETESGVALADMGMFSSSSEELLTAVTSNDLVFDGSRANAENNNQEVPLFSPSAFDDGSSVSHLDEGSYRAGTENALMTPFLAAGEAVHDPGPITLGIFADMGWPVDLTPVSVVNISARPLTVFPNPAADRVTVRLPKNSGARTLVLWSVQGQRIREYDVAQAEGPVAVNLAGVAPGIYVAILEAEGVTYRNRLVVRR